MNTHHFSDLAEFNQFFGMPAPEHPLLSVVSTEPSVDEFTASCFDEPIMVSNDCYTISFKKIISGEISYGRTTYDFKNGSMIFTAPRQQIVFDGVSVVSKSRHIS